MSMFPTRQETIDRMAGKRERALSVWDDVRQKILIADNFPVEVYIPNFFTHDNMDNLRAELKAQGYETSIELLTRSRILMLFIS